MQLSPSAISLFCAADPAIAAAVQGRETMWLNADCAAPDTSGEAVSPADIEDARARLSRFAPYLETVFPETAAAHGIIESPLTAIPRMQEALSACKFNPVSGTLLLKQDSELPISGSVKARGGIYEVLCHAEELAIATGRFSVDSDYRTLAQPAWHDFFSRHTIQVGSTGNLGLSIGIMSAQLRFRVIVHMSQDAKAWKKDLLRSKGVIVREYASDYAAAVREGRRLSEADPDSYFIDDENSSRLFLGYAVAGRRLADQLAERGITVDASHPLFVYLPCGIGGAPGGITYGLKTVFGDQVHCFFAEPTQACCMLLGLATGLHDQISVQDFGLSGKTDADGLAVPRPSAFVGRTIGPMISGVATIDDSRLHPLEQALYRTQSIYIEPSSAAGFAPLLRPELMQYCKSRIPQVDPAEITHIVWATGGSMVPEAEKQHDLKVTAG